MNTWGNEYGMPNQYSMPPNMSQMMPNMMSMQPLVPPMCMMPEIGNLNPNTGLQGPLGSLIGPVMPDTSSIHSNDEQVMEDVSDVKKDEIDQDSGQQGRHQSRFGNNRDNNRSDRRDRDFDRDRSRRHSRSRDRNSRNDRNRGDERNNRNSNRNEGRRRDRPSKWGKSDEQQTPTGVNNMQMMPGMMPYMMNNSGMGQQGMDMGNMNNMGSMSNVMPGMNMMSNMMPGMMDPNMMMMNQQMPLPNQPIYFSIGMLLPPLPGMSLPNRREKPQGCRTIFVGGIPNGVADDVMSEIFQRFGTISDVKLHRQGVCHVRFDSHNCVEQSFLVSGYRFKLHEQTDNEATTIFVDYALNRDDQNEYERNKRRRDPTPPRIEPFTPANLTSLADKIKNDEEFIEVAPTLHGWLERGECTKKYSGTFYSLIQAANNQVRRLFNDKMQVDEEYTALKSSMREKYLKIITQFEQIAKILTAAKHQRVSDHFTKQQRRNIEMWLKMTEEVENIREEFNLYFDDEETEKPGRNAVSLEKYEELKTENENLMFELEGYRNEAHLAKDEAERKFEKFKAQFIAQQALKNPKQVYPPLPPPPMPTIIETHKGHTKPEPPPPTPDDMKLIKTGHVSFSDAKLISVLTAFLLVHPLGASLDYLVAYVRSMMPGVTQGTVNSVLQQYSDIFRRKTTNIGHNVEHKWEFVTFDALKHY